MTKSINSSTAPTNGCSRSFQLRTDARIRRQNARGSSTPNAAQTPVFQSTPLGISGQAGIPTADGSHRLPDVDVGRTGHEHARVRDRAREARLLAARHEMIEEYTDAPLGRRA